jgi:hypothetical protein
MQSTRWRSQDGFIRETIWLVLVVVVVAVVVLDGIAIFSAHQSIKDDAQRAAQAAATEYVQSQSIGAAKLAAQQGLLRDNEKLTGFSVSTAADGSAVFTVTARAHADTRAFRFLSYVGLKKWVNQVTNPSATATSQ